jgi:hypothetical protein
MATLYELTGQYIQLMDAIESDDYELKDFIDFEFTDNAFEEKAENYAKIIKNFEAEADALKAEESRLKDKRTKLENNIKRLKNNLEAAMIQTNKRKFKRGVFNFSIQKNGGKVPVIVDVPVEELDDKFVIVSEKPDTEAIRKYIEETGDVTQFHLGERGEGLRIR